MNIFKNCIDINLLMDNEHIYAYINQNNYIDKKLSSYDNKIIKIILQSDNIYYFSYLPIDIKQYIINMIFNTTRKYSPLNRHSIFDLCINVPNDKYGLVYDKEYHINNSDGCNAFIITFNKINKSCILIKHKSNMKLIFNNNSFNISPCNIISFDILNNSIHITTMAFIKNIFNGIYILSNNYDLTFQGLYKK